MGRPKKGIEVYEKLKGYYANNGKFPSDGDIRDGKIPGVARKPIRTYFGNYTKLKKLILNEEPLFTKENLKKIDKVISNSSKFFITTAVTGAKVDEKALSAVKSFCKKNGATLLITPCVDTSLSNVSGGLVGLENENIVVSNIDLNDNIAVYALKLTAKQINPTTGLGRFGQRNKSFIFASPKQSLEYVPVSNNKMPHALMTTGAITLPEYGIGNYMSLRTSFIAENDHVMGGLVIEIKNSQIYHFRQVQFNKDGSFSDLGIRYYPNGKTKFFPIKALTLGDWHCGSTCPNVKGATDRLIKELKPENIVLHDFFDGKSVNHHVEGKSITKHKVNPMTIVDEGKIAADNLKYFNDFKFVKKIHVVKSNHDEWLDRYLESSRYVSDTKNLKTAFQLGIKKIEGSDVVRSLIELVDSKMDLSKVNFLKRDQDLIFNNVQYGTHGDFMHKSMSYSQLEKAFGKSTSGHKHTAGILRGVYIVGTSTKLRESYAVGPVSWTNTHEVHNQDGSRQLINIIDNSYKI